MDSNNSGKNKIWIRMHYTNILESSPDIHSSNAINYEIIKRIGGQWEVIEPVQIKLT